MRGWRTVDRQSPGTLIMRIAMLLLVCLVMYGCASDPVVRVDTVEVYIPIIEPCPVDPPVAYDYESSYLTKSSSDFDKIRAILIEIKQRAGVESALRALLDSCIKPMPAMVKSDIPTRG